MDAPVDLWALVPVYWMAHALMAGSVALAALVVEAPDPLVVFLSELEHAAASNAVATSAIETPLMPVLMGLLVMTCGGVCQTRRLRKRLSTGNVVASARYWVAGGMFWL